MILTIRLERVAKAEPLSRAVEPVGKAILCYNDAIEMM